MDTYKVTYFIGLLLCSGGAIEHSIYLIIYGVAMLITSGLFAIAKSKSP